MNYQISIIIKATDRKIARDITNLIKEKIEQQEYYSSNDLELLDIGYIKTKKQNCLDKEE